MKSKLHLVFSLCILGASLVLPLRGDDRVIPPVVAKIWPVGMQRGTTAAFTIDGRNFSGIKDVIFDSPGITAKVMQLTDVPEKIAAMRAGVDLGAQVAQGKKQTVALEITASGNVEPGIHWFRIQTPLGTSNTTALDIGSLPEVHVNEGMPGRSPAPPVPVRLPATFVGTIAAPGDADSFQFEGEAGEELVFRVVATHLGSKLESQLVLRDDSGKVLAQTGRHDDALDAVLTYQLSQPGTYTVSIEDRREGGGMDHFYRLDAGPLPYITHVFPLGVRAGQPTEVAVTGVNLGSAHTAKVTPPNRAEGWTTIPLAVKGDSGWSFNHVRLAVGNEPSLLEQEPNNTPAQAQVVSLPVAIDGHIDGGAKSTGSADEDYFRFHAKKGERLTLAVAASRLGSPLDSVIEVLDAQGNPIPRATIRCINATILNFKDMDSRTPKILLMSYVGFQEGDYLMLGDELDQLVYIPDQPDGDRMLKAADGERWTLLGTSPSVHATNSPVYRAEILPPGADYSPNGLPVFHLTWRNDDGGPGYGSDSRLDFVAPEDGDYLVRLKDVRGFEGPDFAYRLTIRDADPDYQLRADPDNPNIPKGGATLVTVAANRVRDYEGPIEIKVEGLPRGVTAAPATIPAGQDSTLVIISADQSAATNTGPAPIRFVGHGKVEGGDLERVANEGSPLQIASILPPPDIAVTTNTERVSLKPGQDAKVTLHLERRNGFEGRVPCTVLNLPPGVIVVNVGLNGVLVTESQSTRTFTLHADEWAKPVTQPIYVVGKVESNSPTMNPSHPVFVEVVGTEQAANGSGRQGVCDIPGAGGLRPPVR